MKLTLGIDEAGRGPAIGPMVVAAVCLETKAARALSRMGLSDSKAYGAGPKARKRRELLASEVLSRASYAGVRVVGVDEIDARVQKKELNLLEREVAEELMEAAPQVHRIVADGARLFAPLKNRWPMLEAMDKAESKHASVAAASVLAKHRRDELFSIICKRYEGLFGRVSGGGYVNQPTRDFLRSYATRFRRLPPEARRSWPHPYLDEILGAGWNEDRKAQLPLL